MSILFAVEFAIAALGGFAFASLYAWRSRWDATAMGRHMMAFAVVGAVEATLFLLTLVGVTVPVWLFAVAFAALDVVVVQRLVLLWRAQTDEKD